MITKREVHRSNDNVSSDEVTRLLHEIEKMKEISRVNDERTRLMSEEMSEKLHLLNFQVESVKRLENVIAAPEVPFCNIRKYPQIQIVDDSDQFSKANS